MMACWMAQAIPPPLVHRISLTFIWFVRTLPRFSPLKRSTSNYLALRELLLGSVPVFFAQHFGFQQRGEAVPP